MGKLYDKNSIESLPPREFTRLKPGVYCGSTDDSTQLLIEILSNAIDEFRAGHGNTITITIDGDIVKVKDNGQGFLINEVREDGETVFQASFDVMNTSGKYREDGAYDGVSLGNFGIGAKLPTFLSLWLKAITCRDGKSEQISFVDGIFQSRKINENFGSGHGTEIWWQPDPQFFKDTKVNISRIKKLCKDYSRLCKGLTIYLSIDNKETEKYYSSVGILEFLNDIREKMIPNLFYHYSNEYIDLALGYTTDYSSTIIPYVNTGLTDTGPHITQMKTTITRLFNKFFKEKKWLKDKDSNFNGDDVQEGLFLVFNITTKGVKYDAQVKSRVTEINTSTFMTSFADNFYEWLNTNEKYIKVLFDKANDARKAREAAKKAREKVREKNQKKNKALKFASKLADCSNKNREQCEIYIVEGDSAAGNLKLARDNRFQAVIPIRGKLLNTQKTTVEKVLKNAEIMTIIEAFGLTLDPKTCTCIYNKQDLRYGKIIIMSDADIDGAHIKNLFYTFIWNFCPELIKEGYIYAGVPPLYRAIFSNGDSKYIKNDAELEEFRKSCNKKYELKRMKG